MTDHYAALGVAKTATQDEIKQAFRRMASKHHPDKGGDTARFQEVQAAYDTLGDATKRAEYDNPKPQFGNFQGFSTSGVNIHDIFGQMFGAAGPRAARGHVRLTLWIQLHDCATGGKRTVTLGTHNGTSAVEIEIPMGIDDGDAVQYQGIGPGGADLVVTFRVHPDPNWERQGINLICTRKISIWDLVLGGDLPVKDLLNNDLITTIPANTQPGTLLRLRGRGLKHRNGQIGDIFVRTAAILPTHISPDLIEAIQKYRE
jgi:DnaJ-class molecular chaperone